MTRSTVCQHCSFGFTPTVCVWRDSLNGDKIAYIKVRFIEGLASSVEGACGQSAPWKVVFKVQAPKSRLENCILATDLNED